MIRQCKHHTEPRWLLVDWGQKMISRQNNNKTCVKRDQKRILEQNESSDNSKSIHVLKWGVSKVCKTIATSSSSDHKRSNNSRVKFFLKIFMLRLQWLLSWQQRPSSRPLKRGNGTHAISTLTVQNRLHKFHFGL